MTKANAIAKPARQVKNAVDSAKATLDDHASIESKDAKKNGSSTPVADAVAKAAAAPAEPVAKEDPIALEKPAPAAKAQAAKPAVKA